MNPLKKPPKWQELLISLAFLALGLWIARGYIGTDVHPYPQHDSLGIEFTYRNFLAHFLHQGTFPLWDHWGNCGLPTGANPVGTILFSPIFWLISLVGAYSLDHFVFEYLVLLTFGFFGMAFWLGNLTRNPWIRAYGAFCFIVSCPVLGTLTNFSIASTFLLMPLLAASLRRLFLGQRYGVPLTTLSLVLIFTEGYPGMTAIFAPLVFLFCALVGVRDWKSATGRLAASFGLFLMIESFPLLEMWHTFHFNFSVLRPPHYDPLDGSANGAVLYSLFLADTPLIFHRFPGQDPTGAGYLYFGAVNLAFIGAALSDLKSMTKWVFGFFVLSFLMALTKGPGPLLTAIYLPLKMSRWHASLNGLFVFFGIALSVIGLDRLGAPDKKKLQGLGVALVSGLFLVVLGRTLIEAQAPFFSYWIGATAAILGVTCLSLWPNLILRKETLVLILIGLGTTEVYLQSQHYRTYRGLYSDLYGRADDPHSILWAYQHTLKSNWPTPQNIRMAPLAHTLVTNSQYLSGEVALLTYSPALSPIIQKIYQKGEVEAQLSLGKVFDYEAPQPTPDSPQIKLMEANHVELEVSARDAGTHLLWTSPYSEFWEASNGLTKLTTRATPDGLTEIDLPPGTKQIQLDYRPPYWVMTLTLAVLGYLGLILCFFWGKFGITLAGPTRLSR